MKWDEPVLEAAPDADLEPLLEATAINADVSTGPPLPRYGRIAAPTEALSDEDSWEPEPGAPEPPMVRVPRSQRTWAGEVPDLIQEAAVWQSEAHPRWPAHSGQHSGEFMRVGEFFTSGGKRWQIAHIVKGRIYAHEASAKTAAAETKAFDTSHEDSTGNTVVADVKPEIQTTVPKGGKGSTSQITVVDPYVDPASHDPSIPIPANSEMTPEQWQRFGKVDQEHYTELMERFGKHKPGGAKTHVDAAYAAYSAKVQQLVKSGYSAQYGSSSGYSLSIAAGHTHSYGGYGISDTPENAKLRQECLALQAEHKAAVQWDLYNRTKSPDVLLVHKDGSNGPDWWQQNFIDGNKPIMSGLSQSFCYRRGFFGSHGVATPLAIRHVLLSSASAQPIPGSSHFPSELEVSVAEQMKYDARSIAFTAVGSSQHGLSSSQIAWLEGMTNEPVGGHVLEMLRDSLKNGTYLPPPPKPPHIVMDGAGGKTWIDPPSEASKPDFYQEAPAVSNKDLLPDTLPKSLPWKHLDESGNPKAVTGKDAGVKQGDYFMGLKGTLYYVGHDPGQAHTGYPFTIHKIVNGGFTSESFPYNPDLPGYYLEASHEHVLEKPGDMPTFHPHEWVKSTEQKFMDQFETGEKFKLEGNAYEVTGKGAAKVLIKDLETGKTGSINGDYMSTWLIGHDGAVPTAADASTGPSFAVGDHVVTPDFKGTVDAVDDDGTLHVTPHHSNVQFEVDPGDAREVPTQSPVVGMTLPYLRPGDPVGAPKVKATVTKVMANGDVQINLKPGKVVIPKDEWDAHSISAYDVTGHTIGEKVKLRDLKPGDVFHGSQGNQTHRPYEVIFQTGPTQGGQKTWVRNLDTGEITEMSAHKSYPTLDKLKDDASALEPEKSTPSEPTEGGVGPAWDPAKFTESPDKTSLLNMSVGTIYTGGTGSVWKKTGDTSEASEVTCLESGGGSFQPGQTVTVPHVVGDNPMTVLIPKGDAAGLLHGDVGNDAEVKLAAIEMTPDGAVPKDPVTNFDPGNYFETTKLKVGEMRPGTIFVTKSKAGPKYYQLSEDGAHTTNLVTGKVYDVKPHFKATKLSPGPGAVTPQGTPEHAPGTKVTVGGTAGFHDPHHGETGTVVSFEPETADMNPQYTVKMDKTGGHLTFHPDELTASAAEEKPLNVPKGAMVFFNPSTKQTGLTHAVALSQDPMSGIVAVQSPYTGGTVFVGPEEISHFKHYDEALSAHVAKPGTLLMNSKGDIFQKVEGDHLGAVKVVANGENTGSHMEVGAQQNLGPAAIFHEMDARDMQLLGHPMPDENGATPGAVENQVHSDSKPQFGGDSKPLIIGQDAYVHGDKVTVGTSGEKPGTIKVTYEDGTQMKLPADLITQEPNPQSKVPLNSLKPGSQFTSSILGDSVVGEVVKNQNGELHIKSAKVGGNVQGIPVMPSQHTMLVTPHSGDPIGPENVGNKHTQSPLGTNKQGMTFGEMPLNTVFSPGHGGIKYRKINDHAGRKVSSAGQISDGTTLEFKPDYVPDDLHELPATAGDVGKLATAVPNPDLPPSLAWTGSHTGMIAKVRESDGAVMFHGSSRWHKPEHTTIHDASLPTINGGDVVHSEDGNTGTFVRWDSHPNGELAAVVDTTGNYDLEFWDPQHITGIDVGTGMEQSGTVLGDKSQLPTPHDQLTQGDMTTLGALDYGDVFQVPGIDEYYKVISPPAPNAPYDNAYFTLAPKLEDGSWGNAFKSVLTSQEQVEFHTKAADYVPVEAPPLQAEPTDYPDALTGGFVPFTNWQGGPYAHSQIGAMPQGTVFEDSAGNVWKVKQAGMNPVISGGAQHYQIDGSQLGKDLSQGGTQPPQHVDQAGPLGGGIETNAELAAAEHETVFNDNQIPIGEMSLKPGDYVWYPETGMWHYDGAPTPISGHKLVHVSSGKTTFVGDDNVPAEVSPSAFVGTGTPSVAVAAPPEPAASLYSELTPLSGLDAGQKFTHAKGSTEVHEVVGNWSGGNVHTKPVGGGAGTASVHPGTHPVYTIPDEPTEAPAPEVPAAPTGDPAEMPPVEGPNGFAPEQPKPVLDPNWETAPPPGWDPFTNKTGSGGVVKYQRLTTLQPGQMITDRSGKDYRVVEHGSATTVIEDVGSGAQFGVDSGHRVKATALPPDPGPQLKGVVLDLTHKYGSLEQVPKLDLNGHATAFASDGKTKNPRLGHLKYGDHAYDADGHGVTFLGAWLDRALVLDHATNEARLASGRTRVTLT